jgi:hypothetical protein
MGPNMYLYEKAREAHYHDLQHEMAEQQRLSHLPRHRLSRSRRVVGKLGVLLLKLGTQPKQFEQAQTAREVRMSRIAAGASQMRWEGEKGVSSRPKAQSS